MIDDRRNLIVRADRQKFRGVLLTTGNIHRHHPIGQSKLFKHNGDFTAIRGSPGIEIYPPVYSGVGHAVILVYVKCVSDIGGSAFMSSEYSGTRRPA